MKSKHGIWTLVLAIIGIVFISGCVSQQQKAPETSAPGAEKTQPAQTQQQATEKEDFGCFPSSCLYIPDAYWRGVCEEWKAGKEVFSSLDCSYIQSEGCKKLCEFEKNSSNQSQQYPINFSTSPQGNFFQLTGIPDVDPEPENVYIYVTDFDNNRIIRFEDMTGKGWVSFGTNGSGVGQLFEPTGIALDKMGRIYIVDWGNRRIARIDDMTGKGWISYDLSLRSPFGIDLDSKGRIYVADGTRIVRMDNMNGDGFTAFGAPGTGINQFNSLKYVKIDSQDRIYVGDKCSYRIVRINDMTGNGWTELQSNGTGPFSETCGGVGKPLSGSGVGQFNHEIGGIELDSHSRIYVADEHNHRIVRVDDMSGTGWTEFKGIGNDTLYGPHDVSITKSGKIYLADSANNRIIRIDNMNSAGFIAFGPYPGYRRYPPGLHKMQMFQPKGILVVER